MRDVLARWRGRVQVGRLAIIAAVCLGLSIPAATQPAMVPVTELAAGPDEAAASATGAGLLTAVQPGPTAQPLQVSLPGAGQQRPSPRRLEPGPQVALAAPPPLHAPTLAYRTTYRVSAGALPLDGGTLAGEGQFAFTTASPPPTDPLPFTLTFDDCGPAANIQAILSALAGRGLHAIFFPTGMCRDQYPWLVPALIAAGHRVCNHTYSHPDLTRLSYQAIQSEIARGVSVGCNLFRPPYGAMDRGGRVAAAAASLGYRIFLWDVDPRDWAGTPAAAMVAMIRARGGVVVMHMQGRHTAEAIRAL